MIDSRAIVEKGAFLDYGVEIGAFCCVSKDARIGSKTKLMPHSMISGKVSIGSGNTIFPFCHIGGLSQIKNAAEIENKPNNKKSPDTTTDNSASIVIGSDNVFRENVTISLSSSEDSQTIIGSDNIFMAVSHVGHDCVIGNNNILANNVCLGGYVVLRNNIFIGGNSAVHQRVMIGDDCMISGLSGISEDVPPFSFVFSKNKAVIMGANLVGLRRSDHLNRDEIKIINQWFNNFDKSNIAKNFDYIEQNIEKLPKVMLKLVKFYKDSSRCRSVMKFEKKR